MVGLVETMLKLHGDSLRLTAYGLRLLTDAVHKHVGAVSREP